MHPHFQAHPQAPVPATLPPSATTGLMARLPRPAHLLLLTLGMLGGCGAITVKTDPALSARTVPVAARVAPIEAVKPESKPQASAADGLRLARLLRDQQRLQAATEVYAQLEQRSALAPLEMLEYASVAAAVLPPEQSLALYGRARRALGQTALPPAASATLCAGLGQARMALGQTDAALADFDCVLKADADNVSALNAKGVLLDAAGDHAGARALFERANVLAPADTRVLNNLALSHLASRDHAKAVRLLRQAQTPEQPALTLNLALAYTLQGDDKAARSTLASLMPEPLAEHALADFDARRARIAAGQPVADELLAASRHLLALRQAEGPGNE